MLISLLKTKDIKDPIIPHGVNTSFLKLILIPSFTVKNEREHVLIFSLCVALQNYSIRSAGWE